MMKNEYLVGLSIKGQLKNDSQNSYNFMLRGKEIRLDINDDGAKYFKGFLTIEAQNWQEAFQFSSGILYELLDTISLMTGGSFKVMHPFLILKAESGNSKRIVFRQSSEEYEDPIQLRTKSEVDAIQKILNELSKLEEYDLSLRWIRYGNAAQALIEGFVFYWLSFERLLGETKIEKECPHCHNKLKPYSAVDWDGASKLFTSNCSGTDEKYFKDIILKMRHRIFHGGKVEGKTFGDLKEIFPKIKEVIEKITKNKYLGKEATILRSRMSNEYHVNLMNFYSFPTLNPDEKFALDYPNDSYIKSESGGIQENVDGIKLLNLDGLKEW